MCATARAHDIASPFLTEMSRFLGGQRTEVHSISTGDLLSIRLANLKLETALWPCLGATVLESKESNSRTLRRKEFLFLFVASIVCK